jgi:hypothetical protein
MDKTFYLLVTGPKVYLPGGRKLEAITVTQEEMDEMRDEDETEQEVIDYFAEEAIAEWAQGWCIAQVITKEEYEKLKDLYDQVS